MSRYSNLPAQHTSDGSVDPHSVPPSLAMGHPVVSELSYESRGLSGVDHRGRVASPQVRDPADASTIMGATRSKATAHGDSSHRDEDHVFASRNQTDPDQTEQILSRISDMVREGDIQESKNHLNPLQKAKVPLVQRLSAFSKPSSFRAIVQQEEPTDRQIDDSYELYETPTSTAEDSVLIYKPTSSPITAFQLMVNDEAATVEDVQFKSHQFPLPAPDTATSETTKPNNRTTENNPVANDIAIQYDMDTMASNTSETQHDAGRQVHTPDISLADSSDNSVLSGNIEDPPSIKERRFRWLDHETKLQLQIPELGRVDSLTDQPISFWCGQPIPETPKGGLTVKEMTLAGSDPSSSSCIDAAVACTVPLVRSTRTGQSLIHALEGSTDDIVGVGDLTGVMACGGPKSQVLTALTVPCTSVSDAVRKESLLLEEHDFPSSNLTNEMASIGDISLFSQSVASAPDGSAGGSARASRRDAPESSDLLPQESVFKISALATPVMQHRDKSLDPVIGPTLSFDSDFSTVSATMKIDDLKDITPNSSKHISKEKSISNEVQKLHTARPEECVALLHKIRKMSRDKDFKREIVKKGGMKAIVDAMCRHSDDVGVQDQICSTILSLLCNKNAENKILFRKAGGIDSLVAAMKRHVDSAKFQRSACGVALSMMSANVENSEAFTRAGGIQCVIDTMRSHLNDPVVQRRGCGAAWNFLCNSAQNKSTFVQAGGIDCILNAMRTHPENTGIQEEACGASLSLMSNHRENVAKFAESGGIHCVVDAMRNHVEHSGVQKQACGAAWNFMCHVENNFHKVAFAAAGGIPAIVAVMRQHLDNAATMEQACGAARNFMAKSNNNKMAFAGEGGTLCIVAVLKSHPEHAGVQTQGCGAALSLMLDSNNNKVKFADLGGIDCILSAMGSFPDSMEVTERACGCIMSLTTSAGVLPLLAASEASQLLQLASQNFLENQNIQRWSSESLGAIRRWSGACDIGKSD